MKQSLVPLGIENDEGESLFIFCTLEGFRCPRDSCLDFGHFDPNKMYVLTLNRYLSVRVKISLRHVVSNEQQADTDGSMV